jgi:hypothetical protein
VVVPLPENAVQIDPLQPYALWWAQTEACSGRTGSMDAVEWYVVPDADVIPSRRGDAAGYYDRVAGRIVLAGKWSLHGGLVRHEMLHALTRETRHSREYFLHRCGDVVPCVEDCRTEAGAPPVRGPSVVRVPPSALEVEVLAEPAGPVGARFGGHFGLVVTARNPLPYDVVVELPPSGDAGRSVGFSFGVRSHDHRYQLFYNGRTYDEGAAYFRAGETKRAVFDFRVGAAFGDSELLSGPHTLTGGFSTRPAAEYVFSVVP